MPDTEPAKADCILRFSASKCLKKFVVGEGAEFFRAIVDVAQARGGKDSRFAFVDVEAFKTVEIGQGNTVASIEVLE